VAPVNLRDGTSREKSRKMMMLILPKRGEPYLYTPSCVKVAGKAVKGRICTFLHPPPDTGTLRVL
jgi:hypothetical protein